MAPKSQQKYYRGVHIFKKNFKQVCSKSSTKGSYFDVEKLVDSSYNALFSIDSVSVHVIWFQQWNTERILFLFVLVEKCIRFHQDNV